MIKLMQDERVISLLFGYNKNGIYVYYYKIVGLYKITTILRNNVSEIKECQEKWDSKSYRIRWYTYWN